MSNKQQHLDTISIKLHTYMLSAPFVCGFRDKKQKLPFNKLYETTMAKPYVLSKKTILKSAQETYEEGRLFACEFKGKLIVNNKLSREAARKWISLKKEEGLN